MHGGHVIAEGSAAELMQNPASITGKFLAHPLKHPLHPSRPVSRETPALEIVGASLHNLLCTRVCNRSFEKAQGLAQEFGAPVRAVPWQQRHDALSDVALLVNTTNQGMTGQAPLDLVLDQLPRHALVSDLIYVPLETPLLAAARKRGNRTVGGLGMLLNQARPAFRDWFGVLPEITADLRRMVEATL